MRRRQCAASSTATSGRPSATASSASRLATSRIDGRVATTLAARGARDRSAISPKSAPLARRASMIVGLPSSSRRAAQDLELAARDDVRLRALFALLDDAMPGRHRDHLEGADQIAQRLLGHRAEERQRGREQDLRAGRVVVVALGRVDDLRRLRRERRAGEERAEGLEALEVRQGRGRRLGLRQRGRTPGRTRSRPRRGGCARRRRGRAGRRWRPPRAGGSRRRWRGGRRARSPRSRPRAGPSARAAGT